MSEKDPGSQGYDFRVAQGAKITYGAYKHRYDAEQRANAQVDKSIRALDSPSRVGVTKKAIKEGSDAVKEAAWYVKAQAETTKSGRQHFADNEEQYKINAIREARLAGVEIDTEHSASERAEMARQAVGQAVSGSPEHAGQPQ